MTVFSMWWKHLRITTPIGRSPHGPSSWKLEQAWLMLECGRVRHYHRRRNWQHEIVRRSQKERLAGRNLDDAAIVAMDAKDCIVGVGKGEIAVAMLQTLRSLL
jgi:hypothetical protein